MTNNKKDLLVKGDSPMVSASRLAILSIKAKRLRDELKVITDEMQPLKDGLLRVTQELDVLTLKTGEYTITRAIRTSPIVEDFETLKESLEQNEVPFDTVETFSPQMSVVFKEALKSGREYDGLGKKETQYISVRTKS